MRTFIQSPRSSCFSYEIEFSLMNASYVIKGGDGGWTYGNNPLPLAVSYRTTGNPSSQMSCVTEIL